MRQYAPDAAIIMVGAKSDLISRDAQQVEEEVAAAEAVKLQLPLHSCSARRNTGIAEVSPAWRSEGAVANTSDASCL